MRSCLYEGRVSHRRARPAHELRMDTWMAYLDLDELPALFEGSALASARGPAPVWFRRADHLGDPGVPLVRAVRKLVTERTGHTPRGPIGLLTNLRVMGLCFNPVSFYYCFEEDGERLQAAVAHVTSTPWGEQHSYVLDVRRTEDRGSTALVRAQMPKRMHVSPLLGMDLTYDWRLTLPAERLSVRIAACAPGGGEVFDAALGLRRRALTPAALRALLARRPLPAARILARIYSQAALLRLKGAAWHPRPAGAAG